MGFYAAANKNEIMTFAGKLMELEIIMLCEISQTEWILYFLLHKESELTLYVLTDMYVCIDMYVCV